MSSEDAFLSPTSQQDQHIKPAQAERLLSDIEDLESEAVSTQSQADREAAGELIVNELVAFMEARDGKMSDDWSPVLRKIAAHEPDIIVRREDPKKILGVLETDKPVVVGNKDVISTNYANAAILGTGAEGLSIPYTQGLGSTKVGSVVFVAGYKPKKDVQIDRVAPEESNTFQRREMPYLRHITGSLKRENVRFIMTRIPRAFLPENQLTEQEIDTPTKHITRLFTFDR